MNNVNNTTIARAVISGHVQGVSFRYFTQRTARALGLTGWVRNRPDGSVEALFEGERATIEQALAACRQGPPAAAVAEVAVKWYAGGKEFIDFTVRY